MVERYDHQAIEAKWQQRWLETNLYHAEDFSAKPKWYALTMYPYPSGDLHIGHWYAITPSDVQARFKRMQGFNVMFPMGFDAFGLPAENAAIKHGIHPYTWTMRNIERMREQLRSMGAMFDWEREIVTCLPDYYKWNQWFFVKFFKAGLAYKTKAAANWCPSCQTVLANEQVVEGRCERCDTPVTKRDLDQWFFRITKYADELLADLDVIDWPERVKTMQRNWIGRSEGVEMAFPIAGHPGEEIRFFTTRPDTVYGVSFMVLAPEHPLVDRITTPEQRAEVEAYVEQARRQSDVERLATDKEKTGVFTGAYATHALTGEQVPIWIADYVLVTYGTGAIMAVPAHDEPDFEFAQKFGLPIPVVIAPPDWDGKPLEEAYVNEGVSVNSGPFTGLPSPEAWQRIADEVEKLGIGQRRVAYRLHDWLISRQRYWGTPIPIVYCERCGTVAVPEDQLPVVLPEDAEFKPTGESPLALNEAFVNTTCPECGGPAKRETDTMDTFVDSSWYFLRYVSPHDPHEPGDPEIARYWLPVDQYTGGIEHATMHLMYARFFTKAMRDIGVIEFGEPFLRLFNQGIILGEDNEKMSKSHGNVVNPDEYVNRLGADTVRIFLMFLGPWEQGGSWNPRGVEGAHRWLNRVWTLVLESESPATANEGANTADLERELRRWTHRTIKRVTDFLERFRFNVMIASLMEYTNYLYKARETAVVGTSAWTEAIETLMLLLAPAAPHIAEELWVRRGRPFSIHNQAWPSYDPDLAAEEEIELPIQVNGKLRDRMVVPATMSADEIKQLAVQREKVESLLNGRKIKNIVYVPGRLVNIVIG